MIADFRSSQINDLLHSLAEIPGSIELRLHARRFTRIGPAERPGSTYQEFAESFQPAHLPESVIFPSDTDEIVVTVKGALPKEAAADALLDRLDEFVHGHLGDAWNMRAYLPREESDDRDFSLTVFMDHMAGVAAYHAPSD